MRNKISKVDRGEINSRFTFLQLMKKKKQA